MKSQKLNLSKLIGMGFGFYLKEGTGEYVKEFERSIKKEFSKTLNSSTRDFIC